MITFEDYFTQPVCEFELTCGGIHIGYGDYKALIRVWVEHGDSHWEIAEWQNDDGKEISAKTTELTWLFDTLENHAKTDIKWREDVETDMGYLLSEHKIPA
jgi:hypothetical protein